MPKRIQRKRQSGWRMPKGAVYCGRPSKWGNPFRVEQVGDEWLVTHWKKVGPGRYTWNPKERGSLRSFKTKDDAVAYSIGRFAGALMLRLLPITPQQVVKELRGKNLVCWCSKDEPCHCDVLLGIANS